MQQNPETVSCVEMETLRPVSGDAAEQGEGACASGGGGGSSDDDGEAGDGEAGGVKTK